MTTANSVEGQQQVAAVIDHTLLKPEATQAEIEQLCAEALRYSFASVCLNPYWVRLASTHLKNTPVKVCTVAGFPLGANAPEAKAFEAGLAREQGAQEIDMVIHIGALLAGDLAAVAADINAVAGPARAEGGVLKVIIETCLLTDAQKIQACRIAVDSGADFVKTSTGFSKAGATVSDVRLMRETVGPRIGVKASGGIRTLETLRAMLEAGATRIGASAGVAIMRELEGSRSLLPAGNY